MSGPRILLLDEVVQLWPQILPLLASIGGLKRYWAHSPGEAFEHFYRGTWTLWVEGDPITAVCAVSVVKERGDQSLSLRLELVAGKADWDAALAPIEAWGKERGCVRIVMPRARPGWKRRFRDRFVVQALFLEAPIS